MKTSFVWTDNTLSFLEWVLNTNQSNEHDETQVWHASQ